MGFKLYGILGLILIAMAGSGYAAFSHLRSELVIPQSNLIRESIARASAEQRLATLEQHQGKLEEVGALLHKELEATRVAQDKALAVFAGHDLGRLMLAKPALITTRLKEASVKLWTDVEKTSMASLIETPQ